MGCKDSKSASVVKSNKVQQVPETRDSESPRALLEDSSVGGFPKSSCKDVGTENLASIEEGVELKVSDPYEELTELTFPGDLEFGKIATGSDSRSTDCSETSRGVPNHIDLDARRITSGAPPLESKASCGRLQISRSKRTSAVQANETDCMIVHYHCLAETDQASRTTVKEASWTAVVGVDATPIHIVLRVCESLDARRDVSITCDGDVILSEQMDDRSSQAKFEHAWTFTGHIREVHEPNIYEFRPGSAATPQAWYPATLTCLRDDGTYDLVALMSDFDGGLKEVSFSAVAKTNIRRKGANRCSFPGPPASPWRYLCLEVPRCDPMQAVLNIDGSQMVTHYFARVSPPPCSPLADCSSSNAVSSTALPRIEMKVDKNRQVVDANVGDSFLKHFMSGEARSIASDQQRLRCRWSFQLGPFAEHLVELEKRHATSHVLCLKVDGTILVEAASDGLDCVDGGWECHFFLIGQRALNFEVFEMDARGRALATTGDVAQVAKYTHTCHIKLRDCGDLTKAILSIDEVDFAHLPAKVDSSAEKHLSMDLQTLWMAYNILVPYRVASGRNTTSSHFDVDDAILGERVGVAECCSLLACEAEEDQRSNSSITTGRRKKKNVCCSG